ncbi:tRNA-dihydrouridine(47) synthase [NAD(P)(+)]-like [Abeliophyllum distichum]|uniref:tRNA-dihydrouridine(47) synthase [NAD(P)(+)] n=1 Tax=Abeliophyllum distichum TaxID=126358 RepID=A0ABD1RQB6_9LAMI
MDGLSSEPAFEGPTISVNPMDISPAAQPQPQSQLSSEELVAKAIAPVKREFLRPPPVRPSNNNTNTDRKTTDGDDAVSESKPAPILKEKKSKRQLKRERRQEQKSGLHLCNAVAKSGKVSSCPYKDNCRFSHDLEAFKAQKLADLEGSCPFLDNEGPCPYGLSCRFAGTHNDGDDVPAGTMNGKKNSSEMNALNKDVQKLLWKNKMKFPKADNSLKLLGLLGPGKKGKLMENEKDGQNVANGCGNIDGNGSCNVALEADNEMECSPKVLEEDKPDEANAQLEKEKVMDSEKDDQIVAKGAGVVDGIGCCNSAADANNEVERSFEALEDDKPDEASVADELRPLKRAKSSVDDMYSVEVHNDPIVDMKEEDKSCVQNEPTTVTEHTLADTDNSLKLNPREKKLIDFRDKLYLAPLTTVGNLPFRRVCKVLGADVTCGEMAMCTNLLQGQASEWALLRRHSSEDLFGVQICGAYPDTVARTVELIDKHCTVDFVDINMGCPIDVVVNKGAGSALLTKPMRMKSVIEASSRAVDTPVTIKVRTGYFEGKNRIDSLIEDFGNWGATAVTIHGRTRQQRYSKLADWEYIYKCARVAPHNLQVFGNGDVLSYLDWNNHKSNCPELSSIMIARGALIKPWIFTEIKEQRHWDISSGERLNILKDYVRFGLEHWGSDTRGIETTRHFLLEWLSYTCRYIPVGLLDVIPQRINWRPPSYIGRDDLETLMASDSAADWIRISEMLLGKVPLGFMFSPKHKSNAYDRAENG